MADVCCEYTIAGLTLNNDTGDTLMLGGDGIQGLDGAPVRSQVDPRGQISGGIVHTKFLAARIITFSGEVLIRSTSPEDTTAYITAINAVEAATVSALEGILNTPSSLAWTPTGGVGQVDFCHLRRAGAGGAVHRGHASWGAHLVL